ncbi:MAG TPA: FAD-binding oxidoreductase [Galbitalea sp.]|jgi:FAD/FMN-containing dehydrogenase|nr:FAD-binding oxidoreductase [Galbitalea sp.]
MTSTPASDHLPGRLLLRGEPGFEEARVGRVFNGRRPDRQPAAILFAESDDDVLAGVRLAKAKGWTVSVRSGGHSWAAWSVRDDALLIDLGRMRELSFDELTGIVSARPAVTGGDELDPYLEQRGRFFNGGHCPSVGIGGFLLQGGQGWLARGHGWAAENVVALDVVTADGELLRADADQNADLYWAARGCGPSFPGIVTRFHLATEPRFGYVGHTVQVYPIALFASVMTWMYGIHAAVSPDVEIVCVSLTDEQSGTRVFLVSALALTASKAEADAALAPFETSPVLGEALFRQSAAPSSLAEQKQSQERQNPPQGRYVVDNAWVDGAPDDIINAIEPLFRDLPTPGAFTIWFSMAPLRPLPDMAFSLQTDGYVATYLVDDDPSRDATNRAWLNEAMRRVQPVTVGQYLGDSDMGNRQLRFLGDKQFARLREIITARDPEGRFSGYLARDAATLNRNEWEGT